MITQSKTFRSIAECVVPEARQLDDAGWQSFAAIVDHAIAQRPARMQRQLALFLRVLDILALLKYRRSISAMVPAMRMEFLQEIERSRILLFRRGFWGVRTLVLMGYYARPEAAPLIGYRAHVRGWQAR